MASKAELEAEVERLNAEVKTLRAGLPVDDQLKALSETTEEVRRLELALESALAERDEALSKVDYFREKAEKKTEQRHEAMSELTDMRAKLDAEEARLRKLANDLSVSGDFAVINGVKHTIVYRNSAKEMAEDYKRRYFLEEAVALVVEPVK